MKKFYTHYTSLLFFTLFLSHVGAVFAEVQRPALKWQYGGCYSSWCETGWYSSPAIADLNSDGQKEVIASAYSIVALNGDDGSLLWRAASGHDRSESGASNVGRTWPGVVVIDIDRDGNLDIVTAHGGGYLSVLNHEGYFKSGWPKRPVTNELRGLTVSNLDGDSSREIVVTGAVYGKTNTWVYEHNGTLKTGWPQLTNNSGYAYGVFNDNAWVEDITGSSTKEIIVPSDVHYVCAYTSTGSQLETHSQYNGKGWGQVGLWESYATELRGWGDCSTTRAERYRANLAHGAAVVADLDGDGMNEIIVTGNMYDCRYGHPPGKYTSLFIFNSDRSRFNKNGWDWRSPPRDIGSPLSEDYNRIEHCQPNPVVADIDGDGIKEILFSSYDGKVHCFWLDKSEYHSWPYTVQRAGDDGIRFSSEPIVADLDRDGKSEIIFTSWPEKKSSGAVRLGKLHILNYQGVSLYEINLPSPKSSSVYTNGALPAPTIGNIDNDREYELVINTIASGFIAYDLPGSEGAKIQWRTGRNKQFNQHRDVLNISHLVPLILTRQE